MPTPDRLTLKEWSDTLERQAPVTEDSRFPDRPSSGFFDLISRIVRALDEITDSHQRTDLVQQLAAMLGGDANDLTYLAGMRAKFGIRATLRGRKFEPRLLEVLIDVCTASWLDGWTNGALYGNENPVLAHDRIRTLFQEDKHD